MRGTGPATAAGVRTLPTLGVPGVYRAPAPPAAPSPLVVRLDGTGFVGVCWRGPVGEPVEVRSWSAFVETYGGLVDADRGACPGLLPAAVRAYFAQGGRTAWVMRVGPVEPDESATALLHLPGLDADLTAANEGSWGGRLHARMTFEPSQAFRLPLEPAPAGEPPTGSVPADLVVPAGVSLVPGSLLRLAGSGDVPAGTLHWVTAVVTRTLPSGTRRAVATLDPPPLPGSAGTDATVVTAVLHVADADPGLPREETIGRLGLHPLHPRFPPAVLPAESALVRAGSGWGKPLVPSPGLAGVEAVVVHGGLDRFAGIDRRSFFDEPADDDPLDEREHRGVDRIGRVEDLGLLCVPDLTWAWREQASPPSPAARPPAADGEFRPCRTAAEPPEPRPPVVTTTRLDPRDPDDLAEITDRQQRLVAVAELRRRFVVLLDVPTGLPLTAVGAWRARFDSTFAAAYHPWLTAGDGQGGNGVVLVPPSAFAAGITAAREQRLGLPWGPANEFAAGANGAADFLTDDLHARLFGLGVNVFRAERAGFRLTSARTLSVDAAYAQLSVRRLMTMIALTLERQAYWLVFEPNTERLRAKLLHAVTQFLGALFRQGAFAGDTPEQSFFVRADEALNPALSVGQGRLVVEVGVAPASPLEFLLLRLHQDSDGGLAVVSAP